MASAERIDHSVGGSVGIAVPHNVTVRRLAGAGSCGRGYGHAGRYMRASMKRAAWRRGPPSGKGSGGDRKKEYAYSIPQMGEKASGFCKGGIDLGSTVVAIVLFILGNATGIALHRFIMAIVLQRSPDTICAYCEWLGMKRRKSKRW